MSSHPVWLIKVYHAKANKQLVSFEMYCALRLRRDFVQRKTLLTSCLLSNYLKRVHAATMYNTVQEA